MRLGVIARSEDRGLGIQTWETCRALNPDRVLLIDPGKTKHPQHRHRFNQWNPTVVPWDGRQLDEPTVRGWLEGLDVLYTAETFYDDRLPTWATQAGCAPVCHVNPEFFPGKNAAITEAIWWAPTPWRVDRLPKSVQVVPMPVATDRFTPAPRNGPVRILHVAGHPAAQDRNGTKIATEAAGLMTEQAEWTIVTQNPKLAVQRTRSMTVRRQGEANYWDLYADHDILVMPRRYGGLCLPVQEAMAAGLAVVMGDCSPNDYWPGPRIPTTVNGTLHTPGGDLDLHDTNPRALAAELDRLVADRQALNHAKAMSLLWAERNSWDALAPRWLAELASASPGGIRTEASVSVLVPYRPDTLERQRAWQHLAGRYHREHPDWEIVLGTCEGPWSKALAVDDAYRRSTGDILVIADADVWSEGTAEAVNEVRSGARWVMPHGRVHRLTADATDAVLMGGLLQGETQEKPYKGFLGGGVVVMPRHLWDLAPMDPRFQGWGHEDEAWALALQRTAGGVKRLDHPLWHLWHPPQPTQQIEMGARIGSTESRALYRRYTRAPLIDLAIQEAREVIASERQRRNDLHREPVAS